MMTTYILRRFSPYCFYSKSLQTAGSQIVLLPAAVLQRTETTAEHHLLAGRHCRWSPDGAGDRFPTESVPPEWDARLHADRCHQQGLDDCVHFAAGLADGRIVRGAEYDPVYCHVAARQQPAGSGHRESWVSVNGVHSLCT